MMDELLKENPQPNTEPQEEFSLEDIMAEFSGVQTETPAPTEEEKPVQEEAPEPEEAPVQEEVPAEPEPPAEKQAEPEKEPADEAEEKTPLRLWTPKEKKQKQLSSEQSDAPVVFHKPHVLPAPEPLPKASEEGKRLSQMLKKERPRAIALWVLTALAVCLTAAFSLIAPLYELVPANLRNLIFVGIYAVQIILALPLLIDGVRDILHKRFSLRTMAVLTALMTLLASAVQFSEEQIPLAAVGGAVLTVLQWGEHLLLTGRVRALKTICSMKEPTAAVKLTEYWQDYDCITRTPADLQEVTAQIRSRSAAEKATDILCPILTALTLAVALLLSLRAGRSFLWVWAVQLLAVSPLGAAIAYARSYFILNKRLQKLQAAVAGWDGAVRLCGRAAVVTKDEDLYPASSIRLNGVKTLGDLSAERLLAYAAALTTHAGAPVGKVLEEAVNDRTVYRFRVDSFTVYSAGIGGRIQGDIVLFGSAAFMRSMSVEFPPFAGPRGSLYLSVNGEPAGVFVLVYSAPASAKTAMATFNACPSLEMLFATRDLSVSTAMLRNDFGIRPDRVILPEGENRMDFSYPPENKGLIPGAFLGRESFLAYVYCIAGSRRMEKSTRHTTTLAIVASLFGFFLTALLCLIGASGALSPLNLLIYHAIWLLPAALITGLVGR